MMVVMISYDRLSTMKRNVKDSLIIIPAHFGYNVLPVNYL